MNSVVLPIHNQADHLWEVIEGYLLGAQVHEQGRLIDPETLTFEGSLRLMPATS